MQKIIKKYWKNGSLCFLFIAAICACLLRLSWLKWGDLIIDIGNEMYIPREILLGKVLYRDIYYYHGPFSVYFNAFLYNTDTRLAFTRWLAGMDNLAGNIAIMARCRGIRISGFRKRLRGFALAVHTG
ncbi:MAG: hypothetical protein QME65_03800 [Candidatus Omnitrophota bacterium]|nr:hypothetical protein [Candidatus Omnitrophota bacterium]